MGTPKVQRSRKNKPARGGLVVRYLTPKVDNDALADVMVAVVLDEINEKELADILYTLYLSKPE
jgi:hypothetical protein